MVKITAKPGAAPVAPAKGAPAAAAPAAATAEAEKEKQDRKSKKRSDFEKWEDFCEYKKQRALHEVEKHTKKANEWEARKAGENIAKAERKLKRIEQMKAKVDAMKAELAAAGIDVSKL